MAVLLVPEPHFLLELFFLDEFISKAIKELVEPSVASDLLLDVIYNQLVGVGPLAQQDLTELFVALEVFTDLVTDQVSQFAVTRLDLTGIVIILFALDLDELEHAGHFALYFLLGLAYLGNGTRRGLPDLHAHLHDLHAVLLEEGKGFCVLGA